MDFQSWYNDFLAIAKAQYYYPEQRISDFKQILQEYFSEGLTPVQAAEQELGWEWEVKV